MNRVTDIQLVLVFFVVTLITTSATAGQKITLGIRHPPHALVSYDQIDHQLWDSLLKRYVDDNGMVDYASWRSNQVDLVQLDAYLGQLGRANVSANHRPEAAIAFWCNAYNAVTIRGILKEYPTTSIRNHTAKMFGYNIWHDLLLQVNSQTYSLNAIEHEILRKTGEKRIHFAIVCASVGCPRLLNEAYTGTQIEEQLARNTQDFFSRPQNLQVQGNTLQVSAIMKWYVEDFGLNAEAGLAGLKIYLPLPAKAIVDTGNYRVSHLDYDWSLNDQSRFRGIQR